MEEWGGTVAQVNEDEDGRPVPVGLPAVGCREEERGGGLLETGVRMIVLAFFLSPSHPLECFIHTKVLTVKR